MVLVVGIFEWGPFPTPSISSSIDHSLPKQLLNSRFAMGPRVRGVRIGTWLALVFEIIHLALPSASASPGPYSPPVCPTESAADYALGLRHRYCAVSDASPFLGLTKGDEVSLQKVLDMVNRNYYEYAAVLFYASWCPFSRVFRPSFSALSLLYPSIPHFAIEESSVRPSIISKYRVHGFPTLLLFNSTMHVRYTGSRTLGSLVAFYNVVTGIKTASVDKGFQNRISHSSKHGKHDTGELESCPFSWARSPEKMLGQETYLALATAFVVLRLIYLFYPTLLVLFLFAWRRHIWNLRLSSLLEHSRVYLHSILQLFSTLKEPCKKSNLQEGAMNAGAWASKSLATVSIGDASTSRVHH